MALALAREPGVAVVGVDGFAPFVEEARRRAVPEKDNAPAGGFYERPGGTLVGAQMIELGGRTWPEVAYAWEA